MKLKSLKSLEDRVSKLQINIELLDSEDSLRNEVQKCLNNWSILTKKYASHN